MTLVEAGLKVAGHMANTNYSNLHKTMRKAKTAQGNLKIKT